MIFLLKKLKLFPTKKKSYEAFVAWYGILCLFGILGILASLFMLKTFERKHVNFLTLHSVSLPISQFEKSKNFLSNDTPVIIIFDDKILTGTIQSVLTPQYSDDVLWIENEKIPEFSDVFSKWKYSNVWKNASFFAIAWHSSDYGSFFRTLQEWSTFFKKININNKNIYPILVSLKQVYGVGDEKDYVRK